MEPAWPPHPFADACPTVADLVGADFGVVMVGSLLAVAAVGCLLSIVATRPDSQHQGTAVLVGVGFTIEIVAEC